MDKIFNEHAFINCAKYKNFDEVIERIKEIDQNDDLYLSMLRQPIFVTETYPGTLYYELENYICHIFDQPISKAHRRCKVGIPVKCNEYLEKIFTNSCSEFLYGIKRKIKNNH